MRNEFTRSSSHSYCLIAGKRLGSAKFNLRSVGTLDVPTEYPSDLVKSSSQRSFYAVIWLRSTGEVRYNIDQRDGSVIDLLKQYPD
jgi:hypothetical protein